MFRQQLEMWQHRNDFNLVLCIDKKNATPDWDGEVGRVTDHFDKVDIDPDNAYGLIVGPPPMYRSVAEEMRKIGLHNDMIYVSFERNMRCGMGKCGRCMVGHQYVCIDGPVFNYWEAVNIQGLCDMATPIFGLNIVNPQSHSTLSQKPARVVFLSLAGDQGCEESILGLDDRLLDMLGLIELVSWPLLDGLDVPDEFDIAVIEGAVCTRAQAERLFAARASASVIIAIGACALTGGIPALSSTNASLEPDAVLSPESVSSLPEFFTARSVSSFIPVDYTVPGCPVSASEFVSVLQSALRGMRPTARLQPCAVVVG